MRPRLCVKCEKPCERRWARYCDTCRWPLRLKRRKYVWTPERDAFLKAKYDGNKRGQVQRIAALWGWPAWVITKRASHLGLCRPVDKDTRRPWTPDELDLLHRCAGARHPEWIARKLSRTVTSVVVQIKRQGLSRLPDGYSQQDVALAFGVSRDTVESWFRRGYLGRHDNRRGQPWRVTEAHIRQFITEHRNVFDLRKVDQVWFLDIVCGPPSTQERVA